MYQLGNLGTIGEGIGLLKKILALVEGDELNPNVPVSNCEKQSESHQHS